MKSRKQAFTLIEVLCVVLIIAMLFALVIAVGRYARMRALITRTHAQIMQIHGMVVEYKVKYGGTPTNLNCIVSMLPDGFTYSNGLPLDPWGQTYQYTKAGDSYTIFSFGPPDWQTGSNNPASIIEFKK